MLTGIPRNPLKSDSIQKTAHPQHGPQNTTLRRYTEVRGGSTSRGSCFLGVETWDELVWDSWEPGREVTKSLTLRNVDGKLQRLCFRPPMSKFFSTTFPHPILLSPGTSFSLPVTFRPLEKREYTDSIEFRSKAGTFRVSLRASPQRHSLEVPESVRLPLCAIQDSAQTTFGFRNASKLRTSFAWKVAAPFSVFPESGSLDPGQESCVIVLFRPQEALVYQQEARCAFGDEDMVQNVCTVLLQGQSKHPHLEVLATRAEEGWAVLEFGCVPVGATVVKHFDIHNPSQVSAPFSLSMVRRPALLESVFECEVREGRVGPGASVRVPVKFSPQAVDATSVDHFCLTCRGGVSRVMLKVIGTCTGPLVSLGTAVLDFGCLDLGQEVLRTVEVSNSGSAQAYFQFDTDTSSHSVFSVQPPHGVLPAHGSIVVCVCFRPHHAIAHHRRIACLVLHREPLFLDLIGTCHSEELKPTILRPKHLHLYRTHMSRGLTCYPPNILSAMLEENKLQLDQEGAMFLPQDLVVNTPLPGPALLYRKPMEEYFQEVVVGEGLGGCPCPAVTVSPSELLFHSGPHSRSISITNLTKGVLTLAWTPCPGSAFSVSPVCHDLAPLKSTAFRVVYAPQQDNTLHGAQLECYAFYKVLRDHHQVDERTLCPPWCLTVRVSGHSFQRGCEHFVPRFWLQRPRVVFPPLAEVSYQTLLLLNAGDLPLTFQLDPEELPGITVKPASGLVLPGSHQILTLRSIPGDNGPHKHLLTLRFNGTPDNTQELTVFSGVERPRVALQGNDSITFQPTAVGSRSTCSCWLRNMSRVELSFLWRVRSSDKSVLSVQPQGGVLQPNESLTQVWSFTPLAESLYTLKASLTFWPTESQECRRSRLSVRVMGFASQGSIQAECPVFDLGEILVGSYRSSDLPLLNDGPCALTFSLDVQQCIEGIGLPVDAQEDPVALELEQVKGTIPACSRLLIHSTARPARRAVYRWSITYRILSANGSALTEPRALCQVQGKGTYPVLEVMDVRGGGSVEDLGRQYLWGLFSLSALNAYLCRDPTPPELTYRVPTRHSLQSCPPVLTPVMLDFDFCAAPLKSEPASVTLVFENTGSTMVEWWFLFPEDQQIELEYWAENCEFSPTELQQMRVQDQRLFTVRPRSGKLEPGQQGAVQLTYRHDFIGTDRLPVLLKVSHGREILLNFSGVTVERDRRYIHFTSKKHTFAPVAIGGLSPPRQTYDMYNAGAVSLSYRVDTAPLEKLMEDNFGHPVLQCLNPSGELLPGHMVSIQWIFSPLEAKTYSVDVPIHILDGDSALITFQGSGFDSRVLGDSAPLQLQGDLPPMTRTQRVPLPGQLAILSEEWISLGDMPVCSRTTSIFFLTNTSQKEAILYTWSFSQQAHCEVAQIRPESGTLKPGESVLCILTLQASGAPTFYQLDIICQVTPEGAVAQYEADLRRWEDEVERQKNEFTITGADIQQSDGSDLAQGCLGCSQPPGNAVRMYKTLPPIRRSTNSTLMGAACSKLERRALREASRVWRRPEPPRPALLHLGVTARSHTLPDFQRCFPARFHKHYVQRCLRPSDSATSETAPQAQIPPLRHGPEREIVTDILTSVIRSLLDDPHFHQALDEGLNEPMPYFTQLRTSHPQRSATQPPHLSEPCPSEDRPIFLPAPDGTAGSAQGGSPSGDGKGPEPASSQPTPEVHNTGEEEHGLTVQECIRRLPEFWDLTEDILLNTLQNLITEAHRGELDFTSQPRRISDHSSSVASQAPAKAETARRSKEPSPQP